jgi:exodeoxyribonuclease V alpha subunit
MAGSFLTSFSELDEIVLAYAISVHKSQGSEYPAVILPLTTQHYLLLQRNLIYTGITRAKRLMVMIGSKKALGIAIRNNKPQERYTCLSARLRPLQPTHLLSSRQQLRGGGVVRQAHHDLLWTSGVNQSNLVRRVI